MTLARMYRYLFYRLYRFSEAAPSRWWSEWKAALILMAIEVFAILTIMGFAEVLIGRRLIPQNSLNLGVIMGVLVLSAIKYVMFIDQEHWKKDATQFESMSLKERKKLNVLFWLILFGVAGGFVLMLCAMSLSHSQG